MQLSDIQTLVGNLTNDAAHTRYLTSDINTELDNTQDEWNAEIGIIKATTTLTTVNGTRQYALNTLAGTVVGFRRVTHKGLSLRKVDKTYLDLYSGGSDWTTITGTPIEYLIEASDPNNQFLTVYPTPTGNDAGANLVVEYILRHTSMVNPTDVPFLYGASSNSLLRPYDWGLAYNVAARLLSRDPSEINAPKSSAYQGTANRVKATITEVFKALEREEPYRLRGGRRWNRQ